MVRESASSTLTAILGATNTGKTRLAIDRMLAHTTGMIGLPLRLLAREVYDRVVEAKGRKAAALITGEERIAPDTARYFIATTEAMPHAALAGARGAAKAEFLALDEIQLARDSDRGHIFTERLLTARGAAETMWLGAESMRPLVRSLFPEAQIERRERFSRLSYSGPMKLTRLPKRSAIVAFSAEEVYAIAELIRRHRGGAAIVMGALSPRTRNAQVALYQNGEVDFLVATDAIGMGLNMDVDHVAFASRVKFDGARRRRLSADETAQIAGRAGRFRNDGTFGETADCPPFEEELVARVEQHEFEPAQFLEWRNPHLDFADLRALIRSLDSPPPSVLFRRAAPASDETILRALAEDSDIARLAQGPDKVARLWAAAQLPDFRKSGPEHHFRLVRALAEPLLTPPYRLAQTWLLGQIAPLDRMEGEMDALQTRLAFIRTWSYVANRRDWAEDPESLRARTRDIEDRLSDALHARLAQRFIDRRTATLLRSLRSEAVMAADVDSQGRVEVDGHYVGRLDGLAFTLDRAAAGLEERALRNAAERALRPELARRLGLVARAEDAAFRLDMDGRIHFAGPAMAGAAIGALVQGRPPHSPRCRLIAAEIGAPEAHERARARLDAFVQREVERHLAPLLALRAATEPGPMRESLSGLARGLAFQVFAAGGAVSRAALSPDPGRLSPQEKRSLRTLGLRVSLASVFMPALFRPEAFELLALLLRVKAAAPGNGNVRPISRYGDLSLPAPADAATPALYERLGTRFVRLDALDRLARLAWEACAKAGPAGFAPEPHWPSLIGARATESAELLYALGYEPMPAAVIPAEPASTPLLWRKAQKRRQSPAGAKARSKPPSGGPVLAKAPAGASPFAALAALNPLAPPPPVRRPRRGKRRRVQSA